MDDMPTRRGHPGDAQRSPPLSTLAALLEGEFGGGPSGRTLAHPSGVTVP
ncbi:hypothetical protein BN2537_11423 [Streptomyces venezuelae]|nr:hypothetical protein BN2537_11423 [Streptomyces venezuelae]